VKLLLPPLQRSTRIEDVQTNAQYRRELVGAMVYRALTRRACRIGEAGMSELANVTLVINGQNLYPAAGAAPHLGRCDPGRNAV